MTFRSNNAESRNIRFDVTRLARIAAVGFSILVTRSVDAGLIEATKEANTKQSSTKNTPVVTSCQPTVDVNEAGPLHAVSSIISHTCSPLNAPATQCNNVLDLTKHNDSNDLQINSKDTSGILSTTYNSFSTGESLAHGHDEHLVYANYDSHIQDNTRDEPFPTYITGHETILIDQKQAQGTAVNRTSFGRDAQDADTSDQQDLDGDSSAEESPEDLQAAVFQPLVHSESFDPLAACVAFLILSGIAIAVNIVPRRTSLAA